MKNERRKRDADYINVTTIYIHLFGCVCLKTGTGGRDSRDPTHAYSAYLLANQESGIFVVRPDGILGAIVDSMEGLERYLKLVFA
jgi:hypothetical protein